jgi:uncharacterized protein (TIGR02996 family)
MDAIEHAFLRAIHDCPLDNAPRRIYADWLEERGEVRAEFIRLQCDLTASNASDCARNDLRVRERSLLAKFGKTLAGPLGDVVQHVEFERGLPKTVTIRPKDFIHNDGLIRVYAIHRAWFVGWGRGVASLARAPHLMQLTAAGFRHADLPYHAWLALFQSPGMERVEELDLSHNALPRGAWLTLLDGHFLPNLKRLNLENNRLGLVALRQLAAAPLLARLREVRLRGNRRDAQAMTILYASPHLTDPTVVRFDEQTIAGLQ